MASLSSGIKVVKKRGKSEGAALTAPSVGLGCDAALNSTFESNVVFNAAPQPEPTKEEIGLSSLESPALSIHLEAVQINGKIFKDQNGASFGSSNAVFNVAPQPEPSKGTKARSFAILRLFQHQYPVKWRPCFRDFCDSANASPPGSPPPGSSQR